MRTAVLILFATLHQLALSVWLGGIVVLGAVAAPAGFKLARQAGQSHSGLPLYDFAGSSAAVMFGRFNGVVLACAAALLLSGPAYGVMAGFCRKRLLVRSVLALAALGLALYGAMALYPELLDLRTRGDAAAFTAIHHTYSRLFGSQALLLLGVTAMTAWMHLSGKTSRAAAPGEERRAAEVVLTPRGAEGR